MLKINTDSKINALQVMGLNYGMTNGFPLLKAQIGLMIANQLCAQGEVFAWSEDTQKLLNELIASIEKDSAMIYFGKTDFEAISEYDVPSEKKFLSIPEDRFHEEYDITQF